MREIMLPKSVKALITVLLFITAAALAFALGGLREGQKRQQGEEVGARNSGITALVVLPKEGRRLNEKESIWRGATAAASVINSQGGILGAKLGLKRLETSEDQRQAYADAKEWLKKERPAVIVGTSGDADALGIASAAEEFRVPFIYLGNGRVKTCKQNNEQLVADYVWGLGLTPEMAVETFLVNLADKLRKPEKELSIYYFGTDDESSQNESASIQQTAESLDFQSVAEDYVDERIKDYFQKVRAIFDKSPDLLIVSTSPAATTKFMEQAIKLGIKEEMAIAGLSSFEEENSLLQGANLEGVFTVSRYAPGLQNHENTAFLKTWRELNTGLGDPTALAASSYGSIMIAAEAFKKAGNVEAAKFRSAIEDLEVSLPQGRVNVSKYNHLLLQPLYLIRVQKGEYQIEDYLGDVSHPLLNGCINKPRAEPSPKQNVESDYDD